MRHGASMLNPDFKDILSALNEAGAEFLVVGAHALAAHGHVRATGDFDIWVRASADNARRVEAAFEAFAGASLAVFGVDVEELAVPGTGIAIGAEPNRIDLHTRIAGLTFEDAASDAIEATMFGQRVRVLSHRALVAAKKASIERRPEDSPKRAQDVADLAWLESLAPKKR
jgi:hypothetical protein